MNQLKNEGWMHHLARHLVACFLTRGDLWVSWEEGREKFEKYLVDYDWSINNFSWHWMSASAFFHQYFRVYSPVAFFKKTDKEGKYIKKDCPKPIVDHAKVSKENIEKLKKAYAKNKQNDI